MRNTHLFCLCASLIIVLNSPVVNANPRENLITRIENTYKGINTLKAAFKQKTHIKALNKFTENHGHIFLQRPGKIRLEYLGAPKRNYISNGKRIWTYTPGDTQVMSRKLKKGEMPREAMAFLNGFGDMQKLFSIKHMKKKGYLRLTPLNPTEYRQLECAFNSSGILTEVTIINKAGGHATYNFSDITTNIPLPPELFKYNKT